MLIEFSFVVLDVNDENPTFFPAAYNVSLPENIPRDFKVVRLNCTDADVGLNAELSYFITGISLPSSCNSLIEPFSSKAMETLISLLLCFSFIPPPLHFRLIAYPVHKGFGWVTMEKLKIPLTQNKIVLTLD